MAYDAVHHRVALKAVRDGDQMVIAEEPDPQLEAMLGRALVLQVAQVDLLVGRVCAHNGIHRLAHAEACSGAQDGSAIVEHWRLVEESPPSARRDHISTVLEEQLDHREVAVCDRKVKARLANVRLREVHGVHVFDVHTGRPLVLTSGARERRCDRRQASLNLVHSLFQRRLALYVVARHRLGPRFFVVMPFALRTRRDARSVG
mmetsp:Transcript_70599/g.212326  ORF Transcript_70599/g.212326 Transcript_70599/m.212326 type:complete len:204 (+) Transcript_70599:1822-2433(+)